MSTADAYVSNLYALLLAVWLKTINQEGLERPFLFFQVE